MALYEAVIASVPVLLLALATGPLRLLGRLPHRTARRHRRRDPTTDRQTIIVLGVVYGFAVLALTLELEHVGWRIVAGMGLLLAAYLVFVAVWAHVRASYTDAPPAES